MAGPYSYGPAGRNIVLQSVNVCVGKVLTVDSVAMAGLKQRYDGCEQLLGSSPLLLLSIANKPQKPLTVTVTNAGGGKKPKSQAGKVVRTSLLPPAGSKPAAKPFGLGQGTLCIITAIVCTRLIRFTHTAYQLVGQLRLSHWLR